MNETELLLQQLLHCNCLSGEARVNDLHEIQNHVNDSLVADRAVDHGVVNATIRPFDAEIFLDKIPALAVNRIYQLFRFDLSLAAIYQASHLVFSGSVQKYAKGILAILEKLLRSSPDDHGIAFFGDLLNNTFGNSQDAFTVYDIEFVRIEAAFVAASQKRLEQTIVQRISALLSHFDHRFGTIRQLGDLLS